MFSEKTTYHYVDVGIFSAKNINLPRKVSYKPMILSRQTRPVASGAPMLISLVS